MIGTVVGLIVLHKMILYLKGHSERRPRFFTDILMDLRFTLSRISAFIGHRYPSVTPYTFELLVDSMLTDKRTYHVFRTYHGQRLAMVYKNMADGFYVYKNGMKNTVFDFVGRQEFPNFVCLCTKDGIVMDNLYDDSTFIRDGELYKTLYVRV